MTNTMTKQDPRISMDDAIDALWREYYADVRSLAEELKQAIRDGEIENREQLSDRIHETVGGNHWVIYTRNAQTVLLVSGNDGAYADEYGAEGMVEEGVLMWSRMAYAAMEQDLYDALESEGVDVNGDTPAEMLKHDDDEDADHAA